MINDHALCRYLKPANGHSEVSSASSIQHAASIMNLAPAAPTIRVHDEDMCMLDSPTTSSSTFVKPAKLQSSQRAYSFDAVADMIKPVRHWCRCSPMRADRRRAAAYD